MGMMDGMPPPFGGYRPELGKPPPGLTPPPPKVPIIWLVVGALLLGAILGAILALADHFLGR